MVARMVARTRKDGTVNANLDAMTQDMMDSAGITVEYHSHDGFTLWAMKGGYLTHRRFVGYDLMEAVEVFRYELA